MNTNIDKKKLCVILDVCPHYRKGIYERIDNEYDAYFVAGQENADIKPVDMSHFAHPVVYTKKDFRIRGIKIWQRGIIKYAFKKFDSYLVSDDIHRLSHWLFLILCKMMGKKTYAWTHGWYGKESKTIAWVKKRFYKLFTGVFLYGNYARDLMIKEGFSPNQLWVIHNSLDYENQIRLRESNLSSEIYHKYFMNNNRVIIFIGRLTAVKQLDMLINVLPHLSEECNLVFVGGGVEKQRLEQLTKEKGVVDRVWFYGPCYDEKTNAELIYNADLCVAPGNVGLTAMHSMVFGTPVISHNCFKWQMPEFEAIIPGLTGDFYEYHDLESMSSVISDWFTNHQDRDDVRRHCYYEIDKSWNPNFQINVFKSHL